MQIEVSSNWYRDDAFWEAFGPFAFNELRWSRANGDTKHLIRLLGLTAIDSSVLDLCCGPGRYALSMVHLGLKVTAVDLSETYLAELQRRAEALPSGSLLEIVHSDMRDFKRPRSFDGGLCVGLSFGYLESHEEDALVLDNLKTSLKSGASLVLELPTPLWPRSMGSWFVVESDVGTAFVEQCVSRDERRVTSTWRFNNADGPARPFSQRLFTPDDARQALDEAGFTDIKLYSSYAGDRLEEGATKIIAVAKA